MSFSFTLNTESYDLLRFLVGDEMWARWNFQNDGGDPEEIEGVEEMFGVIWRDSDD